MQEPTETSRRVPFAIAAFAVPVLALVAVVATRAVEGPSDSATASARVPSNSVVMKNFAFRPATLAVARGAKVTVTNADGAAHTVTARNGSFDTGPIDGGTNATLTFDRSGTFGYRCTIHEGMTGTVVVK